MKRFILRWLWLIVVVGVLAKTLVDVAHNTTDWLDLAVLCSISLAWLATVFADTMEAAR